MEAGFSSADMFDWNDEEISNIIWGEAEESGDHIVPHPEEVEDAGHKISQKQESSAIKLVESKLLGAKTVNFQAISPERPESSSASSRNGGVSPSGVFSWPDIASSNDTRMDLVFDDSALINKYKSKEIGPRDEEITNFVEYGWGNIGSFDDIDRIFSNHEPMFASVTLGNSDKIWSDCQYTTDSPPKSFSINANSPRMGSEMLSKTSEDMGMKSKYEKQDMQSPDLSFEKMEDSVSLTLHLKDEVSDVAEGMGGESKSLVEKVNGQSTSSAIVTANTLNPNEFVDKGQRALPEVRRRFKEKTKGKSSSSVHVEETEAFSYNHISNSYITPPFSNYANPAEEVPRTSAFESGEFNCQAVVLSCYEITSSEIDSAVKPLSSYGKPPPIAPRENIAKLRKRRQMHAMVAIQRQLQQLGNPVSRDFSAQLSALESPNHLPEGSNDQFDDINGLPSKDLSSSNRQDEPSVLSAAENCYSAEETMLHRLQEVVSKLDTAIRISIRDSLFRLAKSAMQRQETTDVSTSPNGEEHPQVTAEEVKVTDVETDTNPRDRAVAHLLFHRPTEKSPKHPETQESSTSAKLLEKSESGKISTTKLNISTGDLGRPYQQNVDDTGDGYITLEPESPLP